MISILHSLYNGDIIPWERRPCNLPYQQELSDKIDVEERYFLTSLSPDDRRRFEALTQLQQTLSAASEEDAFAYGFSLGLLSAFDVTHYAEQMTRT